MSFHGVDRIAQERSRQINEKNYSRAGDVGEEDVLIRLAAKRLQKANKHIIEGVNIDAIRDLEVAGALIAAAIDAILEEKRQLEEVLDVIGGPE